MFVCAEFGSTDQGSIGEAEEEMDSGPSEDDHTVTSDRNSQQVGTLELK